MLPERSGESPSPVMGEDFWRILVAEDNPADVRLVREALDEHGIACTLHVARDGEEAIEIIGELDKGRWAQRLDLLLVDMHLPKFDGEDILRALRSTEHYAQTPVIVMTSSGSPYDREAAERNAALYYFQKPLTLDEFMQLGRVIGEVLRKTAEPEHGLTG